MQPYLTVVFVSEPTTNFNAAGENEGNLRTLQSIMVGDRTVSALTAATIRRSKRKELQALVGPDKLLRRDFGTTSSGLTFGPESALNMQDAVVAILKANGVAPLPPKPPKRPKKKKTEEAEVEATVPPAEAKPAKPEYDLSLEAVAPVFENYYDNQFGSFSPDLRLALRSFISTSIGYSTTDFQFETLMNTGPNNKQDLAGALAPYHGQIHVTRYVLRQSWDLGRYKTKLHHLLATLKIFLSGFPVGGNQARNPMILIPETVLWRLSSRPGDTGLNHVGYETPVEGVPTIEHFARAALRTGQPFNVAGNHTCPAGYEPVVAFDPGHKVSTVWEELFKRAAKALGFSEEDRMRAYEQARKDGVFDGVTP